MLFVSRSTVEADAIMLSKAAVAPTICEFFVEPKQLRVELGYENGANVEIHPDSAAEHGLDADSKIVVVGAAALSDGAAVQVVEPQS